MIRLRLTLVSLLLMAARPAAAQAPAMSLDASLGTGGGQTNGIYLERRKQALSADLALVASLHPKANGGLFVGANGSYHSAGGSTDICLPGPTGECAQPFPAFTILGTLIGWESAGSIVRVATGLAFAKAEDDPGALGYQARVDGALPIVRHLALVGSVRGTHVPNVGGDRFSFLALTAGIRVY